MSEVQGEPKNVQDTASSFLWAGDKCSWFLPWHMTYGTMTDNYPEVKAALHVDILE